MLGLYSLFIDMLGLEFFIDMLGLELFIDMLGLEFVYRYFRIRVAY
jgi:hypothetical protein